MTIYRRLFSHEKTAKDLPLDVGVISEVLVEGSVVLEGHFEVG